MYVGIIGIVFLIILILQAKQLIEKEQRKELFVYLIIFSLGTLYTFGYIYEWPLPNPTNRLEKIFVPTWNFISTILS